MPMYINTIYTITTKQVKSISYMLVAPIILLWFHVCIAKLFLLHVETFYIAFNSYRLQARYYYPWKLAAYVANEFHSIAWGYHDE